jgi:Tol biopolymer transport system component
MANEPGHPCYIGNDWSHNDVGYLPLGRQRRQLPNDPTLVPNCPSLGPGYHSVTYLNYPCHNLPVCSIQLLTVGEKGRVWVIFGRKAPKNNPNPPFLPTGGVVTFKLSYIGRNSLKHYFFLFSWLIALLLLTACGGTLSVEFDQTPTPEIAIYSTAQAQQEKVATLATPVTHPVGLLEPDADSETIRRAMLNSHNKWQSIWIDAVIVDNFPGSGSQSTHVQMWVDRLSGRFRVLSGPLEAAPDTLQVSDGITQARITLADGTRQTQLLQPAARDSGWQPPMVPSDTIEPHPLDMEIDSRVSEILFPQALAERGGSYSAEGVEDVAGERTLQVAWSQDGKVRDRFWIDASIGIVLRQDAWGKEATGNAPVSSIVVRTIVFNTQVPDEMYSLDIGEKPDYVVDPSGLMVSTPLPEAMQLDPAVDALYFTIAQDQATLQLMRLPGSCVTGTETCPVPELLPTSPVMQGDIHPLVWSPDRTVAAMAVEGSIFTYSPYSGVWNSLALFPIITGDPVWSPDGNWIVFSIMNGAGKDLYAVRPNGTDLYNLTNGKFNRVDTLWIDGFLSGNRLVFSTILVNTSETYTLELQTSAGKIPQVEKVGDLSTQHGILATAPDNNLVVYSDQQNDTATLNLMVLENGKKKEDPRRLTTLNQASIQQVLFSPLHVDQPGDAWIAFLGASSVNDAMVVTLYIIRADGTDLRQLYQDDSIQRISFTGDGEHLIAEGGSAGRLVILSLDGEKKVLDAPGLRLNQRLLGASWK